MLLTECEQQKETAELSLSKVTRARDRQSKKLDMMELKLSQQSQILLESESRRQNIAKELAPLKQMRNILEQSEKELKQEIRDLKLQLDHMTFEKEDGQRALEAERNHRDMIKTDLQKEREKGMKTLGHTETLSKMAVAFKMAAKVQKESNADLRRALLRAKERIEKEEAANVEAMLKHTRLESELEQAKKQMLAAEDNLKRLSKHLGRWKGQVDNEEKERAKVRSGWVERRNAGALSLYLYPRLSSPPPPPPPTLPTAP